MKTPPKIELEVKIIHLREFIEALRESRNKPNRNTDRNLQQNKKEIK